jgi:hypothetical protein
MHKNTFLSFVISIGILPGFFQTLEITAIASHVNSPLIISKNNRTQPFARKVLPNFQDMLKQLNLRTEVPIVLPTRNIPSAVYGSITSASQNEYEVMLGVRIDNRDCPGGNYCRSGMMTGKKITPKDGTLSEVSKFSIGINIGSPNSAIFVKLSGGLPGVYLPYTCGAFCGDGTVVWDQNGYRYSIGRKGSKLKLVVDMANSAIENQP